MKFVNTINDTLSDSEKEREYRATVQPSRPQASETTVHTAPGDFDVNSFMSNFFGSGGVKTAGRTTFTQVFTSGNGVHQQNFYSQPSDTKTYNRNIEKGENLSVGDGDVVVTGDVYGIIKARSGDITVNGKVYGTVQTMSGDVTVQQVMRGGVAKSMSGDVTVALKSEGKASSMSGDVSIAGHVGGTSFSFG